MSNPRNAHRHDAGLERVGYPLHCLRWLLRLFSGSAPGIASIEQIIVIGLCALSGLLAFKHFGAALNADLRLQADRITGPGLPSANTFELSPEDLIAGLGGDRDPGGPELCRLDGSCSRPGQCFAAGTLVAAADGLRAIETIRRGERVWARDVETGAVDLKPVTATFVRPDTPVIELELRSGAFLSERLSVTPGHRFWIEGSGWKQATSLATAPVGSFASTLSASALSTQAESTTVYNLEVEGFHSYFVGRAGALVHNGDDDDPDGCEEERPYRPDPEQVPSVRNGEFARWFNALTPDQFDRSWQDRRLREAIQARLRHPGGLHEWHLVSRANVFKRWGVTAEQIADLRTAIKNVKFDNPSGQHGGPGSTAAHNELLAIIDSSLDYAQFKRRLQTWADYRLVGGSAALPPGLRR